MKFLFVHQNMPGQYRELVQWLARQQKHQIVFLTQRNGVEMQGVYKIQYQPHHKPKDDAYALSSDWETAVGVAAGATEALRGFMIAKKWRPDIIIGHVGWGEMLFLKDILPDVPIIGFFEYFYQLTGGMKGFDPSDKYTKWSPFFITARNAVGYASISKR